MQVTVREAAKAVAKNESTIRGLIAKGEINVVKKERGVNFVDLQCVQALFAKRSRAVTPTKVIELETQEKRLVIALETQIQEQKELVKYFRELFESEKKQREIMQADIHSLMHEIKEIMEGTKSNSPSRWLKSILNSK